MKKMLLILFFLLLSFSSYSQSEKLTGTVIGTEICVDYDNGNQETTTVNTAVNLFDGNFNTFFATYQRSGGWAGLDLGEKHIITSVAYCPRFNQEQRVVLGLFEGANREDFLDAVPLLIIDEKPLFNVLTKKDVDCSRGFRYVRYVGPSDIRCNIAELEFYGYAGEGDDTKFVQFTNLPVVTIHTENAEDIVEKEKYLNGIVSVIYDGGTKIYTDGLEVRGRGNASWSFPKKPYRMKLSNKVNLMGLPAKEKNWTLINNYGDKTLMRNLLAFDLSRRFEMPYTSVGVPVDVVLNGEYKGCYQLCDHIQVATARVDIAKTGTFIEVDQYASGEAAGEWFTSAKGMPVTIKHPEDADLVARYNDIKSHFNTMEASVFATNFAHPTDGFRKYLDVETFLRHFLVGEISGNTDTYWSTYMYRQNNTSDIYYTGPVWDFDIAYENDNRTQPINNLTNWVYATKGSSAGNGQMKNFVNRLMQDTEFANRLKAIYAEYRDSGSISADALVDVVDHYEGELDQAQRLNFMRWDILNSKVHQNFQALGSYDKEVDVVRTYIQDRIEWIDNKLGYVASDIRKEASRAVSVRAEKNKAIISGITSLSTVKVFDVSGKEVCSFKVMSGISIPLDSGVYIIQVMGEETKTKDSIKCMVP